MPAIKKILALLIYCFVGLGSYYFIVSGFLNPFANDRDVASSIFAIVIFIGIAYMNHHYLWRDMPKTTLLTPTTRVGHMVVAVVLGMFIVISLIFLWFLLPIFI
ncbi:MAG: hypothetical protein UY63_C0010G0007 [Parcubacteria group bacterium GW2011_GWA2_51_10]|nr:MAG: hypothetical protein UY63_C0010G0007 [Parcubacteria group bacterium GW2011_GWA2_51_10]